MPTLIERITARLAYLHAQRVYGGFRRSLSDLARTQQRTLRRVLDLVADSDYGRTHGLARVRSVDDLCRAAPLIDYEDLRPTIERLMDGHTQALFRPRTRICMFATSSGTTAAQKHIPVTAAFARSYRRGWNTFGLKMLSDHPDAVLRSILQSSGRHDESFSPCGIPCGAITGLLALNQKRIVRRFYVGRPEIARIREPADRYYTLMRFALVRDVAFCITANPATLIRLAQVADAQADGLIRDIRDGTLDRERVGDTTLHAVLSAGLRPQPERAGALEALRDRVGALRPRDYWDLSFLACWTGGSMGHYLQRVAEWYGPLPIRDIGLLASEGRVSIPLEDNTPVGVLDPTAAVFEFIPAEQWDAPAAETLAPEALEEGRAYCVVLTNDAGLVRYRLGDVVRVAGRMGQAPLVEFLHRAGGVASVAGEKLTEHQVMQAVREACRETGVRDFDFLFAPVWGDPPYYRLSCPQPLPEGFAAVLDRVLGSQNVEYASRRKSGRLSDIVVRTVTSSAIDAMDCRLMFARGSTAEQYKRPCLLTEPGEDEELLSFSCV